MAMSPDEIKEQFVIEATNMGLEVISSYNMNFYNGPVVRTQNVDRLKFKSVPTSFVYDSDNKTQIVYPVVSKRVLL